MKEDDEFDFWEFGSKELQSLIGKFEEMVAKDTVYFFDSDNFAEIIDYYLNNSHFEKSLKAIETAIQQYPFNSLFKIKKAQVLAATSKHREALSILKEVEELEKETVPLRS